MHPQFAVNYWKDPAGWQALVQAGDEYHVNGIPRVECFGFECVGRFVEFEGVEGVDCGVE